MSQKTITRAELSEAVYQRIGLSRTDSAELVELVLREISDTLAAGETVKRDGGGRSDDEGHGRGAGCKTPGGAGRCGMKRRSFLKAGGALIISLGAGDGLVTKLAAQGAGANALPLTEVDSFLAVEANGNVLIRSGKIDCGTGHRIAVAQMVAEELGLPVTRIRMIDGDTAETPDQGSTGGSTGLTRGGMEIRQAAATARVALLQMASQKLGKPEQLASMVLECITNSYMNAETIRVDGGIRMQPK